MGFFDKVKNMFTDEIEDEIKTEMIQVEIPAPAKVETKEEEISDNTIIKSEDKPSTPIFFDDDYFKELEQPKKEVKSSYKKITPPTEKRIFKPTPIISPVYGVLDKNYHKEEITSKRPAITHSTSITLDDVRKKAFGTLEDDLETTLFGSNSVLFNDKIDEPEVMQNNEQDLFEEMTKEDIIDLALEDTTLEEIEEDTLLDENDLFNLIDSMYDDEKGNIND